MRSSCSTLGRSSTMRGPEPLQASNGSASRKSAERRARCAVGDLESMLILERGGRTLYPFRYSAAEERGRLERVRARWMPPARYPSPTRISRWRRRGSRLLASWGWTSIAAGCSACTCTTPSRAGRPALSECPNTAHPDMEEPEIVHRLAEGSRARRSEQSFEHRAIKVPW